MNEGYSFFRMVSLRTVFSAFLSDGLCNIPSKNEFGLSDRIGLIEQKGLLYRSIKIDPYTSQYGLKDQLIFTWDKKTRNLIFLVGFFFFS
jgi:hypothetical protein